MPNHVPISDVIAFENGMRPLSRQAQVIERVLFRRALEKKLEGYTRETALEIADALKEDGQLLD